MKREERIALYEEILDRANRIAGELEAALDEYDGVRDGLEALERYYTGPDWMEDFEADEAGLLPPELKRGVLSEDGIADALDRMRALAERLRAYASADAADPEAPSAAADPEASADAGIPAETDEIPPVPEAETGGSGEGYGRD